MDEENVHEVLRGLTLNQAQFLGFQQGQDELFARLDKLTQVVERLALARAALPRSYRVPRQNVQVEDEVDREYELPEEKEQPVQRREQRSVGNNLKLKIQQFKGTSSPEEYLEWVLHVDKEFKLLTMGCELCEFQETTIVRFLGGLNKEIADMIERQPFVSLEDVIKLSVKVRRQQKRGQLTIPQVFNLKLVIAGSTPQGSTSRWNEPRKEVEGSLKSQAESAKVKEQEVDPQPLVQCRDIKCLEFHGFRHFTSEFPSWREVTIQTPHAIESEVEEAIEDVCGVTSKEKVKYADEGEKLKAQQVVSLESKLEKQRECLENIPKSWMLEVIWDVVAGLHKSWKMQATLVPSEIVDHVCSICDQIPRTGGAVLRRETPALPLC
ncbi:hypothetical protein CRG98_030193 [Punica granatum]|uniref:Retrotransposon gag domain-containing protein n=1 Tax=Punica granatum TaxID=22663 RepID=A0A2I0J083_PUNGR|nr:hypothetical protein CRG98_030193 [Punica granatum]